MTDKELSEVYRRNMETLGEQTDRYRADIARLQAALDAALTPATTQRIADYYRGHRSYVGQIRELGEEVSGRVFSHGPR